VDFLLSGKGVFLKDKAFFTVVEALPDYQLKIKMGTNTQIMFNFNSRLNTARFGALKDKNIFSSVHTDGSHLLFNLNTRQTLKITAKEFMDMVLIDTTI